MEVNTQIVPAHLQRKYSGTNKRLYITIHETGNQNAGAGAQAHANLQSRGNPGRSASWHYQVDDKRSVQSYPHTAQCWHSGKGRDNGNLNSIAIEICVNSDSDFSQAVANAAALTKKIMAEEGIPLANVVQHNNWSGKNCPQRLRSGSHGVTWNDFLNAVNGAPVPAPGPGGNPTPPPVQPRLNPFGRPMLVVDGDLGRRTITEAQLQMGTPADGIISKPVSKFTAAVQEMLNRLGHRDWQGKALVVDGQGLQSNSTVRVPLIGRYRTIWALQSYLGTVRDGFFTRKKSGAVMAMQVRLNNGTFKN